MTPSTHPSPDILRTEILDEARRRADGMLQRAREEARALADRAAADAEAARREHVDRARKEAARRAERILETVAVEATRLRAARMEFLLTRFHDEIRRRLLVREGFDYREAVIALAAEALGRMEGRGFVIRLPAADRQSLGEEIAPEILRRAGRGMLDLTLTWDPSITEAGLVVQDAEGRRTWDNRLLSRLERMWPGLRRCLAVRAGLIHSTESGGGAA